MQTCFTMTLCETFQESPFLTVNKMSNSMYLDHMCFVVIPCDHNRSVMFILDPCHRTKRNFNWRVLAWTELCSSHLTCLSSVFPRNLIQVYYKVQPRKTDPTKSLENSAKSYFSGGFVGSFCEGQAKWRIATTRSMPKADECGHFWTPCIDKCTGTKRFLLEWVLKGTLWQNARSMNQCYFSDCYCPSTNAMLMHLSTHRPVNLCCCWRWCYNPVE